MSTSEMLSTRGEAEPPRRIGRLTYIDGERRAGGRRAQGTAAAGGPHAEACSRRPARVGCCIGAAEAAPGLSGSRFATAWRRKGRVRIRSDAVQVGPRICQHACLGCVPSVSSRIRRRGRNAHVPLACTERTSSLDRRDTEQDARGAGTRTEAEADVRLRSEVLCGLLSCGF